LIDNKVVTIGSQYNPVISVENCRTIEEALKRANVDLKVYDVDRAVTNSWDTSFKNDDGTIETKTNYQIKIWLKRKSVIETESFLNNTIEKMKKHAPKYKEKSYTVTNKRLMLEIDLMDLHYGMLSWKEETGFNYDCKIARRDTITALNGLIDKTRFFKPELILLPIGNDLLHVDTLLNTTTSGTPQDVDSRLTKIFGGARDLIIEIIDTLREIAPVEVLVVPGNHDTVSLFHMGYVIDAWYNNCKEVTVQNSPKVRKYKEYGKSLIGFVHGDSNKDPKQTDLPLIMAQENPEAWARTEHREWHLGHWHIKRETKFTSADTFNGVIVKVIPSLVAADQWHYQKGFVSRRRTAEAYIWDYEEGCTGNIMEYINNE